MDWTKVPYYILDLIQQAPAVDVPGLGRFEAVLHPAVIDLERSEARPPRMETVFHPEDAGDRDLLSAFIAFASGVSESEAHEAILAFADEVAQRTRQGSAFEIIRFGTFYRTPEDKIRFTPDWEAFNISFNGLRPVAIPAPAPEPVSAEWQAAPRSAEAVPEPVAHTAAVAQKTAPSVSSGSQPAADLVADDDLPDVSARMWWGILVSALVLITVLCAYLAWDILSHRDTLRTAATPTILVTPLPVDTQSADTRPPMPDSVLTEVTDELVDTADQQQSGPSVPSAEESCFIVVGAFADTANAIRMEARLVEMGYVAERLSGKTMMRVAIRASCDPVALQNVLDDARARIHPQAWIY